MHKAKLTLAAFVLCIAGCASFQSGAPAITPAMVQVAQSSGDSFEKLEKGRRLLAMRCTTCHALEPIRNYTAPEWSDIVEDMADRSGLKNEEQREIQAYLTAARKTL
jgi:cytochrome c2